MVELLPEIDKERTANNVYDFFWNDSQYPRIKRNALSDGIKAVNNDITGIKGSRRGNSSERMMIFYAECAQAKRAVDRSIKACSAASQDILNLHYKQQLLVWQTKERMNHNLGNSSFTDADKKACLQFAEACDRIADEMNVDPDILPVFLVFKKREEIGSKIGEK